MGLTRRIAMIVIRQHWKFVAPLYLLEYIRDTALLDSSRLSWRYPVSDALWQTLIPTQLMFLSEYSGLMAVAHVSVAVSAVALALHEVMINLLKIPRGRMKGQVGEHFQRWIDWHWVTVGAGVLLKLVAEHNGKFVESKQSWLTSNELHYYCSVFLVAEAAIGLIIKAYMVKDRNDTSKRRKQAKKAK